MEHIKTPAEAGITPNDLDKMLAGLKQEEADIERQLASHKDADADFYVSLNLLLELVQNAGKLFRSADVEQKRKILKLVYWNLELDAGTLRFSLRKPFDMFLETPKSQTWLPLLDAIGTHHYTELVNLKPHLEAICKDFGLAA